VTFQVGGGHGVCESNPVADVGAALGQQVEHVPRVVLA
jgi:hypothetical protein